MQVGRDFFIGFFITLVPFNLFSVFLPVINNTMELKIEKNEKYVIVKLLDKALDKTNSNELSSRLIALNKEGVKNIILDMSNIFNCDSSGIRTLEEAKKMCEKANASFVICGIDKDIRAVFKLVDLDKVVSICPTIDEAKDLIFMEELERDLLKDENNE